MKRYRMRLIGSSGHQFLLLVILIFVTVTVIFIPVGLVALILNTEIYEV